MEVVTGRMVVRRLAVAVYVPFVLSSLGRGMLVPVLPLYLRDAGFSYTLVSVVVAAAGIGAVVGGLPAGAAAQRLGPEWLFAGATGRCRCWVVGSESRCSSDRSSAVCWSTPPGSRRPSPSVASSPCSDWS